MNRSVQKSPKHEWKVCSAISAGARVEGFTIYVALRNEKTCEWLIEVYYPEKQHVCRIFADNAKIPHRYAPCHELFAEVEQLLRDKMSVIFSAMFDAYSKFRGAL